MQSELLTPQEMVTIGDVSFPKPYNKFTNCFSRMQGVSND